MLKFEAISPNKIEDYQTIRSRCPCHDANDSFFYMWAWRERYKYEWAFAYNMCWIRYYEDGKIYYKIPVGNWKKKNWISLLRHKLPTNAELKNINERFALRLNKNCNNKIIFCEDPDAKEYLYSRNDLVELPGKKFHVKRQHTAFFEKIYEYEQKDIEESDLKDIKLIHQFERRQQRTEFDKEYAEDEYTALCRIIKDWKKFSPYLQGKILRVQNNPVGYIIGERQDKNNLLILFEKSLSNIRGAGTFNCKNFVKGFEGIKFINRGQDFGQAELRYLRCHDKPCGFIKKYTAKFI